MPASFYSRILDLIPDDEKTNLKTDAALGRYLDIKKDVVGNWRLHHEAGHTDFLPSLKSVRRVAHALNRPISDLIPEEGEHV